MSIDNPYAAPDTPSEPTFDASTQTSPFHVASQNKRFLNFIIDSILVRVFITVVAFGIGIAYGMSVAARGGEITPETETMLNLVGGLIGISMYLFYYVFFEAICGRTIAKFITGTKVANSEGGKPSFGQVFGRSAARMIPFEPFSFLFGDNRTGWHDTLSGTIVIDTRK